MQQQENRFKSNQCRWQAVHRRSKQADGAFVYAVRTTGIYCRPTCSSRMPNRENVQFFDRWQTAEAAGFRPCKRCAPRQAEAPDEGRQIVARACRLIEEAEKPPRLVELATAVGLSPAHFHRLFKKITGVTPKQYAQEIRLDRVRDQLQQEKTVTDAILDAGYQSGSRFYENAGKNLGMKPSTFKKGAPHMVIQYATTQCYLGWVLVAATPQGICRIDIDADPEALQNRLQSAFPQAQLQEGDPSFADTVVRTLAFLEAPERGLDLPLDIQGTAFQQRVWSALQSIPAGETRSYAEIARQIGQPRAVRAVASACAANLLAVAIPCHRVVRSDGGLGGYRWGIERKESLLEREGQQS